MPVVILVVAGVLASAVIFGAVVSLLALLRGLWSDPKLIRPADYQAEQLRRRPLTPGQFAPDVAWPAYVLRQVNADFEQVRDDWRSRYRRLWKWPDDTFFKSRHGASNNWWILFPIPVVVIATIGAAFLTTMVVFLLFAFVAWLFTAAVIATFLLGVGTLRGVDWLWRRVRGAEASCPTCYHVMLRPAYRCPGCSALHRDVRPGRLGLLYRRCECGTVMPTMVLRAAWRLQAVCQRCEDPLRPGAAALRDVRISIVGDVAAGKTRFLCATLESLIVKTAEASIPLDFPDEQSQDFAVAAVKLVRSSRETQKTPVILQEAVSCRIGSGATSTWVHLFDAAGEQFYSASDQTTLGYLESGQGLIYVLDPFAITAVRDRLSGHQTAVLGLAHAAQADPETIYDMVVGRIRDAGVKAAQQRLAIVVSKTDLLQGCGIETPEGSAGIADWLYEMGLHNLVLGAGREFAEVRYFTVASISVEETTPATDPGAPLRWLLRSRGVRLADEPAVAVAPGGQAP